MNVFFSFHFGHQTHPKPEIVPGNEHQKLDQYSNFTWRFSGPSSALAEAAHEQPN